MHWGPSAVSPTQWLSVWGCDPGVAAVIHCEASNWDMKSQSGCLCEGFSTSFSLSTKKVSVLTHLSWLTSGWRALVMCECHVTGTVTGREMSFSMFLSVPVLTIFLAGTLCLPLYKVAVNNSWNACPCILKHVCPWNAGRELRFAWETICGQFLRQPPWRSPAGHVAGG